MRRCLLAAALAATSPIASRALASSPSGARDLAATSTSSSAATLLPPIVVRGERSAAAKDPTASVTDLSGGPLERTRARGEGVAEVVEWAAGTRILDLGGPAHDRRISIRGGAPAQSLIILDGVPLRTPFATGVDLGLLGPEAIGRLAVVRGGAGAGLGDGALGGALIVDTLSPDRAPRGVAAIRVGSLETLGLRAAGSGGSAFIAGDLERSSGDFSYLSRSEGLPDESRRRLNNDASRATFSLRLDEPVAGGELQAIAGAAMRDGGVPGLESRQNDRAREKRASGLGRLSWRRAAREERLGLDLALSATALDLDYRDPDPLEPAASHTRFFSAGGDGAAELRFEDHSLRVAADLAVEGSRSTEHGDVTRLRIGAAVSDELRLDDWRLFGAVRGVLIGEQAIVVLPRIGASWFFSAAWLLRAAVGRSMRAPAIDELYHPAEAGLSGNPALVSETAWEGELSIAWTADSAAIELTGFVRRIDDAIVYVNQNAFVIRPENVGDAILAGGELEARGAIEAGPIASRMQLAVGVISSALIAAAAPVPAVAPLSMALEVAIAPAGDRPPIEAYSRLQAALSSTANTSGTLFVEPYARLDLGVVVAPVRFATVSLIASNVLDHRALETLNKVPLPGRALMLTVRAAVEEVL